MTAVKQQFDAEQWRRRVDKKLNVLTVNYQDLNTRLDAYAKDMSKNTDLTKGIDKKIDDLIENTKVAVEIAARARWTSTVIRWFWRFSHQMIIWVGQAGVFIVTLGTIYFVMKNTDHWMASFVNIFNGNLPIAK